MALMAGQGGGRLWRSLKCTIVDAATNRPVDAKVHVLSSQGAFVSPPEAILKVGAGPRFFYAHEGFEVDLPIGQADVVVERGTEYAPLRTTVDIPTEGTISLDLVLSRWTNLPDQGWYPGNTHIHYDEKERQPDERLRFDSVVEDYSVTVISVLTRRDLAVCNQHVSHRTVHGPQHRPSCNRRWGGIAPQRRAMADRFSDT